MRLKEKVRWASEHDPYTKVIPVEALRAWLEEQHTSIVGKATVAAMLAELEGVA
jgi:hypothetical protein